MASPSYEKLIKKPRRRRKCCSFINNVPPIFPQESQINNSKKSKHIIKNTTVSISLEFVPCNSLIPRKGYSKALETTKGVKQVKPYCSVKDFPFNYSPAIQFFTTGFLISTKEVGGITGWKPAAFRALSRACGCANSCVWRAVSHQPQDWWDLLTLMSRATAVPANELLVYLTDVLCSCPRSTRGSALKPPTLTL